MLNTSYISENIILEIDDIIIDNTIIKRKAYLLSMIYNITNKTVVLNWEIRHYGSTINNQYGEYLINIIPNKTKTTTADNTTFVNSQTGAFVYPDSEDFIDVDYIGQFDFFSKLAENQPIIVNELIRQYGQQTNWTT